MEQKHNDNRERAAESAPQALSQPAGAGAGKPVKERQPASRKRGSTKRDEVLEIMRNKRKATALFKRLSVAENEGLQVLLDEVIEQQKEEIAAAEAEHQKKLDAATEALRHLQRQGISEREFAALLDEAKKHISG